MISTSLAGNVFFFWITIFTENSNLKKIEDYVNKIISLLQSAAIDQLVLDSNLALSTHIN